MAKLITWIIMVPIAILVIAFAATNHASMVELDLWVTKLTFRAAWLVLLSLTVGFLWGGFVAWPSSVKVRARARTQSLRAEKAERELRHLRDKLAKIESETVRNENTQSVPALPPGTANAA